MNTNTKINKIDVACNNFKKVHKSGIKKFDTLDEWLEKESHLYLNETTVKKQTFKKFKRGQIVKVDFGINIGS